MKIHNTIKAIGNPRFVLTYIALTISIVAIFTVSDAQNTSDKALNKADVASEQSTLNRQAQIRNCEASKQPGGVRYILAQKDRREIAQSANFDYQQLFPTFPKKKLDQLINQQIRDLNAEIDDLLGVECPKLYPKITSP